MAYTAWHDFVADDTLTAAQLDAIIENIKQLFPVGSYQYIAKAATTSETLVGGVWLECNGVSVLRASYPDLNTLLSGLSYPFGAVDGTHFTLPDAQGRSPVSAASGGHADVNGLGDSDGLAKASRTPKGTVLTSGSAASDGAHTHGAGSYVVSAPNASSNGVTHPAFSGLSGNQAVTGTSGSSGAHTHTTTGSGVVPGNYMAGTLFIKAVA